MLVRADFGKLIGVLPSYWRNSKGAAVSAIPLPNALSLVFTLILIEPPNRELYRHKKLSEFGNAFPISKTRFRRRKARLPLLETFGCWLIHKKAPSDWEPLKLRDLDHSPTVSGAPKANAQTPSPVTNANIGKIFLGLTNRRIKIDPGLNQV
jgi:hypothetical protein